MWLGLPVVIQQLVKGFVDLSLKMLVAVIATAVFFSLLDYQEVFCVEYDEIVLEYYGQRMNWKTSNLGTYLFKNIGLESETKFVAQNRSFFILQWKSWGYGPLEAVNHLKVLKNPLEGCSVQNCIFSDDDRDLDIADAVVFAVRQGEEYLPPIETRNPQQLWVWMTEEPPSFMQMLDLSALANIYNWSMSYRSDSDIPMPYGRTIPRPMKVIDDVRNEDYMALLVPNWYTKRRDVYAAILMSHCTSKHRNGYLKELRRYMKVDVYGMCSDNKRFACKCYITNTTYFKNDCPPLNDYLFYLVFENSRCRQYLSEKTFFQAFSKGAIPVIMGPTREDCKTLLPPNSFLHVDSYDSPKELAKHINRIVTYSETILWYHRWRNHFITVNEHGYLGTPAMALCRMCEGLNYNDMKHSSCTEDDLRIFLDPRLLCEVPY